jgi:cell volume regulation protein A
MEYVYLLGPLLLLGTVVTAVWLDRFSVPVILVALGLGLLAGSDVLGLWHFDDVRVANEIANVSLVFILFQGGLVTKFRVLEAVAVPAGSLATLGVALTAAIAFAVFHLLLGWPYERSLLLAAVISSTDAAATFSILRRQSLPMRLGSTIEIESAANDPMAILLTLVVVESLTSVAGPGWSIVPEFLWKFAAGPLVGWLMARGALLLFDRLNPQDRGYYYVLLMSVVLLTYGVADLARASGMLAVFTAGLVMGNRRFIYQQGVRNFSAALSMIGNVGVFVMMGLLVFPSQWQGLWIDGILLFLTLTFVARPFAVWIATVGMGFGVKDRCFMSWAGLRGAVPIVLATYPMAAGIPAGNDVFNLVFFAVLLSVSIQGSTLGPLAKWFRLSVPSRPQPRYGLELVTMAHGELDLFVVDLPDPKGRPGPRIRDLALPSGAMLTLVSRGERLVSPSGDTRLLGWDQVTVLARPADESAVREALIHPFEQIDEAEASAPRILDAHVPVSTDSAILEVVKDHVVLLGHGSVGGLLANLLRRRGIPFVVIEQDMMTVLGLRRAGVRVFHGHGDDPRLLEMAGIARARGLLVTTTQPVAARAAIEVAQRRNPDLEVVVRVQQDSLLAALRDRPRTRCVQTNVEMACAMGREMLQALGVSAIEAEALVLDVKHQGGRSNVAATRVIELRVAPGSAAIGQPLAALALPSGALVIMVGRQGEFVVPNGQTTILENDALIVLANLDDAHAIAERLAEAPTSGDAAPTASLADGGGEAGAPAHEASG